MLPVKKYHGRYSFSFLLLKNLLRLKNPLQLDLLIFQAILKEIFTGKETFSAQMQCFFFLSSQECCYVCQFESTSPSFLQKMFPFSPGENKNSPPTIYATHGICFGFWKSSQSRLKMSQYIFKLPKSAYMKQQAVGAAHENHKGTCNVQNHDFGHCCFGTCTCELFHSYFHENSALNN